VFLKSSKFKTTVLVLGYNPHYTTNFVHFDELQPAISSRGIGIYTEKKVTITIYEGPEWNLWVGWLKHWAKTLQIQDTYILIVKTCKFLNIHSIKLITWLKHQQRDPTRPREKRREKKSDFQFPCSFEKLTKTNNDIINHDISMMVP
jgi:hypothetical protein